jgi:glycosyltransferase involved in cell wall biosynthesis
MDKSILQICLSDGWGGLEMYPLRITKKLHSKGHKAFGLALKGTPVAHKMAESGFDLLTYNNSLQALINLPTLVSWVKNNNIGVIHCHKSKDLVIALAIKKITGCKLIFTEHMGVTKPKKDILHQLIYKNIDQILSISDETRRRNIIALPVPAHKIKRLWLGTDLSHHTNISASDELRAELGLKLEDFVIGILGRITHDKGQLELVQALNNITNENDNFRVLIVGGLELSDGANVKQVALIKEYIQDHNLSSKVIFSGYRTDTADLLAIMDILVLPSHKESFGLTVIEGMAASKAIIGANTGAIPEVLDGTGILVNPFNPMDIASKILLLAFDEDKRKSLGNLARARAEAEFGTDTHIERLEAIYFTQP